MKHTLLLVSAVLVGGSAALKGVAPEDEAKYVPDSDGMWTCLGFPSVRIPFDRVNDDYCDCPDGSDEPGTGACAGVGNTKHYCPNKGHTPAFIPVRYVNDGVCDYEQCCDGSDEPEGACPNRCAEVHKEYVAKRQAQEEARMRGLAEREKLVVQAQAFKDKELSSLAELRKSLPGKEAEVAVAKAKLDAAEAEAAEKGVSAVDEKVLEAKAELTRLSEGALRLRNDLIVAVERQRQLDAVLSKMKEEYNPNFNDPAVKQAIRSWEEIAARGALAPNLELATTDRANDILDEISSVSVPHRSEIGFFGGIGEWLADVFGWTGVAPAPPRDFTSAQVETARQVLADRERELSDIQSRITKEEHKIVADYGPDDVLRALSETCVRNKVGEYDYEVCLYGQSRQIGNGQATLLGAFSGVEFGNDVFYMQFENGARCWNGPIRRAEVTVRCSEKTEIVGVSEPEKCAYYIDMTSPGACSPHHVIEHDEL